MLGVANGPNGPNGGMFESYAMLHQKSECSGSSHNPIQPSKAERLPPTVQEKRFQSCGSISTAPSRFLDWEAPKDQKVFTAATDQPSLFFVCNGITGEKIPLRLVLALRVAAVKQLLEELLQIPADDMRLSYKGKVLHDRCSLLDSGVEARQFIHVSRCGRNAYKFDIPVFLGFKASEPFDIRVRPSDLVIEAKQQIQAITQIPASKQRLTHGGRTLANECRLCDCGVRDDSCSLQVTSCNDVTAPIPEPSIPITGLRTPRAQWNSSAKKRCLVNGIRTEVFLMILKTWPPQKQKKLWLHHTRTIATLKKELEEFCGVATEKQILMHSGRRLQDQHTLEFYNFEGGETLQLMALGRRTFEGPVALREKHQGEPLVLPLPPTVKGENHELHEAEKSGFDFDVPFVDRSEQRQNALQAIRVVSGALAEFTMNIKLHEHAKEELA